MTEIQQKVILSYTEKTVNEPIVYTLAKEYNLVSNIIKANINPDKEGYLVIQLSGDADDYQKGADYLQSIGIKVEMFSENVVWDQNTCTQCGACTGVCPSGALSLDLETRKIVFCGEKCIVCNMCLPACPVKAVSLNF
ncbi:MAG: NIL domain-containing protein [Bacillota bacterium]|jgi:ferredoxin